MRRRAHTQHAVNVAGDAESVVRRPASSGLLVHGADLSCAELCCSSVFSVLPHPSPSDLSLCFPPLLSPVLTHWVIVLSSLPFLSPLHYQNHQSHHSCGRETPPPLLFFFFFLFRSCSTLISSHLSLFHPFVRSILGSLCMFTHSLSPPRPFHPTWL